MMMASINLRLSAMEEHVYTGPGIKAVTSAKKTVAKACGHDAVHAGHSLLLCKYDAMKVHQLTQLQKARDALEAVELDVSRALRAEKLKREKLWQSGSLDMHHKAAKAAKAAITFALSMESKRDDLILHTLSLMNFVQASAMHIKLTYWKLRLIIAKRDCSVACSKMDALTEERKTKGLTHRDTWCDKYEKLHDDINFWGSRAITEAKQNLRSCYQLTVNLDYLDNYSLTSEEYYGPHDTLKIIPYPGYNLLKEHFTETSIQRVIRAECRKQEVERHRVQAERQRLAGSNRFDGADSPRPE